MMRDLLTVWDTTNKSSWRKRCLPCKEEGREIEAGTTKFKSVSSWENKRAAQMWLVENKEKIPAFAVLIVFDILGRAIRKGKEGADAWVETKNPTASLHRGQIICKGNRKEYAGAWN